MFINYFHIAARNSAVNVASARILVTIYALWKLFSYDLGTLADWPRFLFLEHKHRYYLLFETSLAYLVWEQWITAVLLMLFLFGWRTSFTALMSALLLTHMMALHYVVTNSGATWLPAIYMLVFFAIFRYEDRLSLDSLRDTVNSPDSILRQTLRHDRCQEYPHDVLKWSLLTFAATYFFTGYSKLATAGLSWVTAENLARFIRTDSIMYLNAVPIAGEFLMQHRWLAALSSVGTVFLECGFLVAVVMGISITPFIIGLAGLHMMIAVGMRIFFFDQYIVYLLFVPWDKLHARLASRIPLHVVYDPTNRLVVRTLVVLRLLDVHNSLRLQPCEGDATEAPSPLIVSSSHHCYDQVHDTLGALFVHCGVPQRVVFTRFGRRFRLAVTGAWERWGNHSTLRDSSR